MVVVVVAVAVALDYCSSCSSICEMGFGGCGECRVREDGMDRVPSVWIGLQSWFHIHQ